MTLILVLALFRRNLDEEDKIYSCLEENGLVERLFGGLTMLLNGKSTVLGIRVKWADNNFKNKNDRTRLLLLNLFSGMKYIDISNDSIIRLLKKEDELDQNLGLYIITYKLRSYLREYKYYQRQNEMQSINSKDSMEELEDILINQIKYSGKINILEKVSLMVDIIESNLSKNDYEKASKIKLHDALIYVVTEFIRDRNGIYLWTEAEEVMISLILKEIPVGLKAKLLASLEEEEKGLMSSKLDELVRFNIYLEDKTKSDIINGIKKLIHRS